VFKKKCSKCGEEKGQCEFYPKGAQCIKCQNQASSLKRKSDPLNQWFKKETSGSRGFNNTGWARNECKTSYN